MSDAIDLAAVVIGRNEGARLEACLRSLAAANIPGVYVDSNSTDESPRRAGELGFHVVRLTQGPYTAARGRQAGLEFLRSHYPALRYIQFMDGDCLLDPNWIALARARLECDEKLAGLSGRRREAHPEASLYNRLIDIDWNVPAGQAAYFGGDSLARLTAIDAVGGWPTQLIAGEEPDLGFRLCDAGWTILRLAEPMTLHDAAMYHFSQYWRRAIRSGYAYAQVGWSRRSGAGKRWYRRSQSIVFYALVLPLLTIGLALWRWPAALLGLILYFRLGWSLFRFSRGRGFGVRFSLLYAMLEMVCKFAGLIGVGKFAFNRLLGRSQAIIEYKPVPPAK